MESVRVDRLNHCGVIAFVIKEWGFIGRINARLVPCRRWWWRRECAKTAGYPWRGKAGMAIPFFHWPAQRFSTPEAAQEALARRAQDWQSHHLASCTLIAHTRYAGQGRPTPNTLC